MLSKSIRLVHIINKMPFLEKFLKLHNKPFTGKTEAFIESLLEKLDHAQRAWMQQKGTIMQSRVIQTDVPKSDGFSYIPSAICDVIETGESLKNTYTMTFPSRAVTLNIVMENTTDAEKRLRVIIHKVFLWFSLVDGFTSSTCSQQVHVNLYLTPLVKELPAQTEEAIDRIHVNTAFTTGCQKTTHINVFRKEEWFKVLIHETFHNLGLDFLGLDASMIQTGEDMLRQWFHITVEEMRFNESYCEFCAEFLNCVFYSYFTRSKGKRFAHDIHNEIVKNVHTCLTYESVFTIMQCVKILRHQGIAYRDFLTGSEKTMAYTEKTQVFSYYVLIGILMTHFVETLDLIASWKTLKFPHDEKEFMRYLMLIKGHMNSTKLHHGVKAMEDWYLQQHKLYPFKRPYELTTLRMSLLEY